MSGSAMSPVQAAIYARLTGDATLMNTLLLNGGGVKDHVPAGTPFPYINIGEMVETPFRTFGRNGHETVPTLHIWGSVLGYKPLQAILDRVNTLLEGTPLTVSGHQTVYVNFEDAQALPDFADDESELRHIVAHYRIVTQDNQ
jgi:hypothetical protein